MQILRQHFIIAKALRMREQSNAPKQQQESSEYQHLPPATIIAWRYNQKKNTLNLDGCIGYYLPVLKQRDWSTVETLWLRKCGITDSAIADIFSPTTSWPNVSSLRLNENPITVKSLIYFMDQSSVSTQKIKYLGLSNIKLGSNGIKSLVKINLAALEVLNLSYVEITEEGLRHLTKNNWKHLRSLSMSSHKSIGQRGYMAVGLSNWRSLVRIEMWTNDYGLAIKIMSILLLAHSKTLSMNYSIYNHKLSSDISRVVKSKFYVPTQGQPHYYF